MNTLSQSEAESRLRINRYDMDSNPTWTIFCVFCLQNIALLDVVNGKISEFEIIWFFWSGAHNIFQNLENIFFDPRIFWEFPRSGNKNNIFRSENIIFIFRSEKISKSLDFRILENPWYFIFCKKVIVFSVLRALFLVERPEPGPKHDYARYIPYETTVDSK